MIFRDVSKPECINPHNPLNQCSTCNSWVTAGEKKKGGIKKMGETFWAVNKCTRFWLIIITMKFFCLHYSLVTDWFTVIFSSRLVEFAKSKQNWFAKTSHQSHNFCSLFYMKEAQKSGKKVLKQKSLIYCRLALFILQRLWLKWGLFLLRNTLLVWIYLEMNFVVNRI